jgi:thiol-disulfide isomerase/thioredoxin
MRLLSLPALLLALSLALPTALLALQTGEPLPDISGTTLDGAAFDLKNFKGKTILLKVGTTWCPGCIAQAQEIDKIRDFLKQQDVQYIEVFVQESPARINSFFTRYNLSPPDETILDSGKIARALNVYLIPRLILIDSDHNIYRDGEPLAATELKQTIAQMLELKQAEH